MTTERDTAVLQYDHEDSWPPPNMWTPPPEHCRACADKTAYRRGESCSWCGLRQDGTRL